MRWLIDGYNVMHAGGRLRPNLSRVAFRHARRRFLDDLAHALGPANASETTVVLDASVPPGDFPPDSTYHGVRVIFALGDENADARIEALISEHSSPKSLTVVSSDNRIKLAASRRRCRSFSAEKFLDLLDTLEERRGRKEPAQDGPAKQDPNIKPENPQADASYWLGVFSDLDESPEIRQGFAPEHALLTDAQIKEIEREIEQER
jgi:predicted RNA-binding protein with PIN domain